MREEELLLEIEVRGIRGKCPVCRVSDKMVIDGADPVKLGFVLDQIL